MISAMSFHNCLDQAFAAPLDRKCFSSACFIDRIPRRALVRFSEIPFSPSTFLQGLCRASSKVDVCKRRSFPGSGFAVS
jgi:hypothetical protein